MIQTNINKVILVFQMNNLLLYNNVKNDLYWYNTLVVKRLLRYSVSIVVVKKSILN